jgi:FkbM family methyltransferase
VRKIVEIGEHSIWGPGLNAGEMIVDCGANQGFFSLECARRFGTISLAVEANPELVSKIANLGIRVHECALGAKSGTATFHLGENDESSSTRKPKGIGVHLQVQRELTVQVSTLQSIIEQEKIGRIALVKMDVEGVEAEVLSSISDVARNISPQWTVEFHEIGRASCRERVCYSV